MMEYTVPQKKIPVFGEYDVCVVGGGTSGVMAALAAAREGLKTLIVEQFGSLGGSATMGLVLPIMYNGIHGNPQCSSFGKLINTTLAERGYNKKTGVNTGFHDSLYLRFVLDELCSEYGVDILYNAFFNNCISEGKKITGVTVAVKGGEQAIFAKRVVDCTGDADVAVAMGCPYEKGNPVTAKNQPISLRYILGGIDIEEFSTFLSEASENGYNYTYPNFYTAVTTHDRTPLEKYFKQAVAAGDLDQEDYEYWQVFSVPGRHDGLAFNCPEFFEKTDGTDPRQLSYTHTEGRRRILRQLNFYKKYFRGFDNAYVAEVSEMVGIRESRRIKAEYVLTAEDVVRYKKSPDSVCQSNYPVDVHGMGSEYLCKILESEERDSIPFYDIPYLVTVPREAENLLVAGRCSGFDFIAQASARVQHSCRALGEAAGIACKLSIDSDLPMKAVKGSLIREKMISYGAEFAPLK